MAGPVISITVEAFTGAAKSAIDGFFSGIQAASTRVKAVNQQWQEFSNSITGAAAAFAAYFGVAKMTGFVREAAQAREAMARLGNEIRKSGQPLQEFTADLEAQRVAFQRLTGTDDDVIVSIQTMLLTMGVQRSEMRQNTLDVLNLAAALGIDAVTAAKQLGNALAGDSFSLRGLRLDIDTTLPKAKQLEQALAQMRAKTAGQAESKFLGGAPEVQRLTVAMGELRKEIGNIVIDSGVIETLKGIVDWMRSLSKETKEVVFQIGLLSSGLVGLVAARPILIGIAALFAQMATAINLTQLGLLTTLIPALKSLSAIKAFAWLGVEVVARISVITASFYALYRTVAAGIDVLRSEKDLHNEIIRLKEQNAFASGMVTSRAKEALAAGRITLEQEKDVLLVLAQINSARASGLMSQEAYSKKLAEQAKLLNELQTPKVQPTPAVTSREITQAELDAQIAAGKAGREAEREIQAAILKDRFDQRKISDTEYFQLREEALLKEAAVEKAINETTILKLNEQRIKALNDPNLDSKEKLKAEADYIVKVTELRSTSNTIQSAQEVKLIELAKERRDVELARIKESLTAQAQQFETGEKLRAQALQTVENDWRLTEDEKLPRRVALLDQEVAAYDAEIATLANLRDTQADTFEERIAYQERIAELSDKRSSAAASLQSLRDMPDPNAFGDQLTLRLVQLRAQWGSMARNMATVLTDTVTNAVNGLSNALTSVIMGTQSAGAAFRAFGINMLTSFISSVISMILMAKVAIPILTALGVLSGGSIPAAGAPATIASVFSAQAAVGGSFADGGVIRGVGGPRDDRVLIRASPGEGILPAASMAYYGYDFFEALRRRLIDVRDIAQFTPRGLSRPIVRGGAYADGGMVAGGVAGDVNVMPAAVNVAVLNSQQALRDFMAQHGSAMAFDYARKHKAQLGVRS